MAESVKSRVIHTLIYLWNNSDEEHQVTVRNIIEYLNTVGISAERHTVASDIDVMIEAGVDIVKTRSTQYRYFIGSRQLQRSELKLLIDAVEASRFISPKRSAELINKLSKLAGASNAESLTNNLYITKPFKTTNDLILYTVDQLDDAITKQVQVTFQYYEYDINKQLVLKHDGYTYHFSPYKLVWSDDNYYVIGYSEKHKSVAKFRVDRITKLAQTKDSAELMPKDFNIKDFCSRVFQMYDGAEQDVVLKCDKTLMKAVIDKFGEDVKTKVCGEDEFLAYVTAMTSPTFFAWVFTFKGKMKIEAPESVKYEFNEMLAQFTD